eukprot:431594_1
MPRNKWGTLTDGVLYLDPVPPVFKNPNAFQNFVAKLRLDDTNRVVTLTCILFILIVISTFFQLKFEQNYYERQQKLLHREHENVVSPSTTYRISTQTEGVSDYGQKRKADSPTSTASIQTDITVTKVFPETKVSSEKEVLPGTKIVQIEQKGKQRESIAEPTSDDYRSDGPSPGFREYIIENTDNADSKTDHNKLAIKRALINVIGDARRGNFQYADYDEFSVNVNTPLSDDEADTRSTWTTAFDENNSSDGTRKRQGSIHNTT